MFLLLDENRVPVTEIMDYLSVTVSIRFTSPSLLDMKISETSDIAGLIKQLMYVYQHETKTLFLIDFVQRDTILSDSKAIVIKANSVEGFLEQRVVIKDKLLDGTSLQTSIEKLITENIISPTDSTRTVDFFRFVASTDPIVVAQKVKGLVSGISVMSAISSLLESKNLGYKATYDIDTKLVTFKIKAGRNLCDGFTSVTHGAHLPEVVTLSVRSDTLSDVKRLVDLAPYKTRVYVKNFDSLKTFNRGTTKSGIHLREGYITTGHGNDVIDPILPFPGPIPFPEPIPPGEVPLPDERPETSLIGLYVLTSNSRLLACAFYPGLPIPDAWFDVTPDPVDGVPVSFSVLGSRTSSVSVGTGDLVIASSDRKKLYRVSMIGGWFGIRTFSKAVPILDVGVTPYGGGYMQNNNFIGSLGMDVFTGQVAGTIVNTGYADPDYGAWQWGRKHHALFFNGTAQSLSIESGTKEVPLGYPEISIYPMVVANNRFTLSGTFGTGGSKTLEYTGATWEPLDIQFAAGGGFESSWHARPVYGSDAAYFASVWYQAEARVHRTLDMFGTGSPMDNVVLNNYFDPSTGAFSVDGKSNIYQAYGSRPCVSTFGASSMAETVQVLSAPKLHVPRYYNAGLDSLTKTQMWGYMNILQGSGEPGDGDHDSPTFFVSAHPDLSSPVNMTPMLKDYLILSSGLTTGYFAGYLNEWPIHAWPILGG